VKVHPGDKSRVWHTLKGLRRLDNVTIVEGTDFYELLPHVSVVVTMHSTAGAEAICAGKPVVAVDIRASDDDAVRDPDYVTFGAAYAVRAPGTLVFALREILTAGASADRLATRRSEYGEAFLTRSSISAAERIASHLVELAARGRAVRQTTA
jgi:hypothetical protein